MQPQHVTLDVSNPTDPQMQRWVELMRKHAGQSTIVFLTAFFTRFWRKFVTIYEYAYTSVDFRGDPDLALPEGAQWGAMGKNVLTMFFDFPKVYTMFLCFDLFPRLN